MPDLNHLWQRFLLASSLIVGLVIGIAATVFGYDNRTSVDVHWSVFHINGVPLWTVAVVPLALFLIAGTVYHWMDGLHHFTEHMRHRRRVHELEAEVASLRAHLDQVLEMPDHSTSNLPPKHATTASLPAAAERVTELGPAEAEPITAEPAHPAQTPQVPALNNVDGSGPVDQPSVKKSRSSNRKRARLEVAGAHGPLESGSRADGMTEDGTAVEPGDKLQRGA